MGGIRPQQKQQSYSGPKQVLLTLCPRSTMQLVGDLQRTATWLTSQANILVVAPTTASIDSDDAGIVHLLRHAFWLIVTVKIYLVPEKFNYIGTGAQTVVGFNPLDIQLTHVDLYARKTDVEMLWTYTLQGQNRNYRWMTGGGRAESDTGIKLKWERRSELTGLWILADQSQSICFFWWVHEISCTPMRSST